MPEQKNSGDQAAALRSLAGRRPDKNQPRVVTIASGKGGVGKSVLASNLALAAAARGTNVLLIDADANLGSLDTLLGLSPDGRLQDLAAGRLPFDEVLAPVADSLWLIAGTNGMTGRLPSGANAVESALGAAAAHSPSFDLVIVDAGAGIGRDVIDACRIAGETWVVATPEPTSIMDAYALIKIASGGAAGRDFRLVLNRVSSAADADEAALKLRMAVTNFLGFDVTYEGAVPDDRSVADAVRRQQPVLTLHPNSTVSRSIRELAGMLAREGSMEHKQEARAS
jgi:flagellar biosynthesis protein FlhG